MCSTAELGVAPAHGTARAFGLELAASFAVPGLSPAEGPPAGRQVRLDLVEVAEIDRGWRSTGSDRILDEGGNSQRTIDVHSQLGYRLYAAHFGLARIWPGGERIACAALAGATPWSWQSFLVGRVLPWASVLAGHEVLHASAVAIDGRAVGLVGPSGAGKTSLALQLVARGADFVTDDVLALDRGGSGLRAHPGAATASARPSELSAFPSSMWNVLDPAGPTGKTLLALAPIPRPLPLAALCFLEAGAGSLVEPVEAPDPRRLLASTFVLGVRTRYRLRNQLDVYATIAREVPLLRVRVGPGTTSRSVAAAVWERLGPAEGAE